MNAEDFPIAGKLARRRMRIEAALLLYYFVEVVSWYCGSKSRH
jgi:hypothetical protein